MIEIEFITNDILYNIIIAFKKLRIFYFKNIINNVT